jgi:hypothetical protein
MNVEVRFCTTEDCNRLTSLFLCTSCMLELDELLRDLTPILERIDAVIYRQTQTRAPGAGGGGGVAGSKPAMDVDAYMLKAWLHTLPSSAHSEAENPTAGQTLYMARIWIAEGRDLVWGPEDKRVYGRCGIVDDPSPELDDEDPLPCEGQLVAHPDDQTVKCPDCNAVHQVSALLAELRKKARGQPQSPREVRELLQRKARVMVSVFDFKNYAKLGKLPYVLERVNTEGRPSKLYYPGDVLDVHMRMRDRRRHIT